jgi:hypothetical protein
MQTSEGEVCETCGRVFGSWASHQACPWCEAERLRAIVDKLPTTADGVLVLPNEHYWVRTSSGLVCVLIVSIERTHAGWWANDTRGEGYTPADDLYSTRQAAGKAREA